MIRLIDLKLQHAGVRQDSTAQIVMTGGASTMPGFFDMAEQYIPNCSIRMGAPNHLSGMSAELEAPAYSTGVGILLYGFRQEIAGDRSVVNHVRGTNGGEGQGLISRIKNIFNS